MLSLSEFQRQPYDRVAFDTWVYPRQIESALGPFSLELQTELSLPPDDRMLELASQLVDFVRSNAAQIGDLVFASYRRKAKMDPDWLRSLGLSLRLSRTAVLEELEKERWLRVSRDSSLDPPYVAVVHVIPRWDHEHAFRLTVREGQPVELNDSPTQLRRLTSAEGAD